jgi:phosphonate transport system substrate-binding protein
MFRRYSIVLFVLVIAVGGCGKGRQGALGTAQNPIRMALVPSLDTKKLSASGKVLAKLMEKETGLKYKVDVPTSYTAVIAAMGAGNVDVGWLSPIPYVIAHDKYGVKVILTTVRDNSTKYWSFIITRTDSGINKLADLKGKTFAYGDPVSTSGSIYPKHLIRTSGFDPHTFFKRTIHASGHDKVVMAVYFKQADAGAIYGGVNSDAREKVSGTIKDVMKKTKVIARSQAIPNDTVSVRKGLPPEITRKIRDALIRISKSDEGRIAVMDLYGISGFVKAKDSDYDSVRKVAKAENIKLEQIDK